MTEKARKVLILGRFCPFFDRAFRGFLLMLKELTSFCTKCSAAFFKLRLDGVHLAKFW
jgi:hypothetical protein